MLRRVLLLLGVLFSGAAVGQDCSLKLYGRVLDESTGIPLAYTKVFIEELKKETVSDSSGWFRISQLCIGEYHVRYNHIGCESQEIYLNLTKDTTVIVLLGHHAELLNEITVNGRRGDNLTQKSHTISKDEIAEKSNENLADIIKSVAGVSSLNNGSGISKPVIQGLYGNRITILNNGIAQSGQQWGNDHAPEIDPMVADHISVVKGASSLAYSGTSLGGVVLVEPNRIPNEPHLHGKVNYVFQTNGLGNTLNLQLAKKEKHLSWRTTGTLKLIGDRRTPDYFLTNTGSREANLSVQLDKNFSEKWQTSLYYSLFNTKIGILRGSHIGNLTDLEQAFTRDKPFFTSDSFSYKINAPSQLVHHHLLKLSSKLILNEKNILNFVYGGQLDNRNEYDVRRGGRSDIPALGLTQFSHYLESTYKHLFDRGLNYKVGIQVNYTDNTNNPETGILPLIPDYISNNDAAFFILSKESKPLSYEFGLRYDYNYLYVWAISNTLPRVIEKVQHHFHNLSSSGGVKYEISKHLETALNVGYVARNPAINELYSIGLHQGVSGIEEGTRTLKAEHSLKATLSLDWNVKEKFFVQMQGYYQRINDFIFLEPQPDFRLTIRGAFPVFIYKQTDASLAGLDLTGYYQPFDGLKLTGKYSFLKGQNLSQDVPLIYMPSNNLFGSIDYAFKSYKKLTNTHIELNGKYVFKQKNLLDSQDLLPPPDGYLLLGAEASTYIELSHTSFKLYTRVENMLNARYRDYLNRQRYFADETGVNVVLGCRVGF